MSEIFNMEERPVEKEYNAEPDMSADNTVPVVKKQEKKSNLILIFSVICVFCVLLGGVVGGFISGSIVKNNISADTLAEGVSVVPQNDTPAVEQTTQAEKTTQTQNNQSSDDAIVSGTSTSNDEKPSADKSLSATDIYANNVASVVSIEVKTYYSVGYGTGFIVSEDGYIVTNYHVVEGADSVTVTLYDESVYTADVIGYEESNDLAVIKIEPKGEIQSVIYGKSTDLKVGADVYVIGNPLGDLTFTLTKGVVSALNRLIDTGSDYVINMFQTDAAINSGNSGGPVFDQHGFVVGIASAKYASSSIEGLCFCVPIDDVRSMIDEIINNGYVTGKPLIGVSVYDKEITNYGFLQSSKSVNGAKIAAIGENTAASKAGLAVGDVIVAIDNTQIKTVSALKTALSSYRSGDIAVLTINRGTEQKKISVILGEYEPSAPRTNYSNVYDL